MKDNYPMGAALDPSAPYNQSDPKPVEVDCCVSYSLSKSMPVKIQNYSTSEEYESDMDDEGHRYCNKIQENHFDDTNFIEEFKNDSDALGIPTLLMELQNLCKETIEVRKRQIEMTKNVDGYEYIKILEKDIQHYELLIKASKDWVVDELDVCQE